MNAKEAENAGCVKSIAEFPIGSIVMNVNRVRTYPMLLTKKEIKYYTEWPPRGTYFRLANDEEKINYNIECAVDDLNAIIEDLWKASHKPMAEKTTMLVDLASLIDKVAVQTKFPFAMYDRVIDK